MKKTTICFLIICFAWFSPSVFALEGPFLSNGVPTVRISDGGALTVFGLPASANCHKDKASLITSRYLNEGYDVLNSVLSVVLAAQTSGKNINVWIDRYNLTGSDERCALSFIEMVN